MKTAKTAVGIALYATCPYCNALQATTAFPLPLSENIEISENNEHATKITTCDTCHKKFKQIDCFGVFPDEPLFWKKSGNVHISINTFGIHRIKL